MSLSNSELATLLCSPSRIRALSDAELMEALRSGCNDALAILFERHSAMVLEIARGKLHDDGEAEETVQRIFVDIFRAKDQFNPDQGSFEGWLLKYAEPASGESLA
jgi:RNA polymerase sigma-70 factor, ECF subfamily